MMPEECPAGITRREEASPTAARGVGRPRDYGDFLELPPPRIRLIDATWRRTRCISCARDSGSATATMPGETLASERREADRWARDDRVPRVSSSHGTGQDWRRLGCARWHAECTS